MKTPGLPTSTIRRWIADFRATIVGLQFKATVLVVALLATMTTVLCGLTVGQAWRLTRRLEHEQAVQKAETIARVMVETMGRDDFKELNAILRKLVTGDPLWFAHISDADGNLLTSVNRAESMVAAIDHEAARGDTPLGSSVVKEMPDGTRYVDLMYPVVESLSSADGSIKPAVLGYVHLGINRNIVITEFDAAADLAIGVGLAMVLVAVPAGFLLVRRMVVPLNEMAEVAKRFSDGDMRARVRVQRSDEIGVLATNLNQMADEIARKHTEVVNLNAELEQRVMERTAQLRELASRDPLTGLYNRRHFGEVLSRRFSEARRYGSELSLLIIDLDDFKPVNDAYGHQTGDELLVLAALTISSQLRAADVAARYGGDEFVVLLPQSGPVPARALGDRIAQRFRERSENVISCGSASLSIGIASLKACQAPNGDEFIRAADRALYEAKNLGKNRVALEPAVS